MPTIYKDRVLETTSTIGTVPFLLEGAVQGYQSFSTIGNGNSVYYSAFGINAYGNPSGQWEVGQGVWTADGRLTRATIFASSTGGAIVDFAGGVKRVAVVVPANRASNTAFVDAANVFIRPQIIADSLRIAYDGDNYAAIVADESGDLSIIPSGDDTFVFGRLSVDDNLTAKNLLVAPNGMVQLGGVTNASPALTHNGTTLEDKLADNSDYADFKCRNLTVTGTQTGGGGGGGGSGEIPNPLRITYDASHYVDLAAVSSGALSIRPTSGMTTFLPGAGGGNSRVDLSIAVTKTQVVRTLDGSVGQHTDEFMVGGVLKCTEKVDTNEWAIYAGSLFDTAPILSVNFANKAVYAGGPVLADVTNAETNTRPNALVLSHSCTATPVAGYGIGLAFSMETDGGSPAFGVTMAAYWLDPTTANHKAELAFTFNDIVGPATIVMNAGGIKVPSLRIEYDAANYATLTTDVTGDLILGSTGGEVKAVGNFTSPAAGHAGSEKFGAGASMTGGASTAIGSGAAGGYGCTSVGYSAGQDSTYATAVGAGAKAGFAAVAIGSGSIANGASSVTVGYGANSGDACVVLGMSSVATAANQLVIGSSDAPIYEAYIGKGVTNATPANVRLNATTGSGPNIVGGSLAIAPGKSTGNATPAKVVIQSSVAGTSGAAAQTLVDTLTVQNGGVAASNLTLTSSIVAMAPLDLKFGDDQLASSGYSQIAFQLASGGYRHFIKTAHSDTPASNRIIFGVNSGDVGSTPTSGVIETLTLQGNGDAALYGRLMMGGNTASYPALKRNAATLEVKLADDSDYGDFKCRNLTVTGTATGVGGGGGATNPLRIQFDATHYADLTVNAAGSLAITPTAGTITTPGAISAVGAITAGSFTTTNTVTAGSFALSNGASFNPTGSAFYFMAGGSVYLAAQGTTISSEYGSIFMLGAYTTGVATHAVKTLTAEGATASQADKQGSTLRIAPGRSNGTAVPASVAIQSSTVTSSGTGQQAVMDTLVVTNGGIQLGINLFQKVGFYGAAPVARLGAIVDADGTLADLTTKFNTLLASLRTIGLIAP